MLNSVRNPVRFFLRLREVRLWQHPTFQHQHTGSLYAECFAVDAVTK